MNTNKSLNTFFIFILGVFVVSGLSYITSFASPNNTPTNSTSGDNASTPIYENSTAQGRCATTNNDNQRVTASIMYTKCSGAVPLKTNGLFITGEGTTSNIDGKIGGGSSYASGALYVGCTTSGILSGSQKTKCSLSGSSSGEDVSPNAILNGNIYLYKTIGQGGSGDKTLCIDSNGEVGVCD